MSQKSAKTDEVNPIYQSKCPVTSSVKQRLDSGKTVLSRLTTSGGAKSEFFFTLELSGPGFCPPESAVVKKMPVNNRKSLGGLPKSSAKRLVNKH